MSLIRGAFAQGVKVRFAGDSDVGEGGRWARGAAEKWAHKTGNQVEYISRPNDTFASLQQCQQYWAARSPDIDVYMIDVIWQSIAAPHAVDMKKFFKEDEIKKFFPRIVENNTVGGGLVSIPWYTAAGLLYYRTDLLEKYGYKQPPKTWEELDEMAKKSRRQNAPQANQTSTAMFFQGKAGETVTCDALEWIYSCCLRTEVFYMKTKSIPFFG